MKKMGILNFCLIKIELYTYILMIITHLEMKNMELYVMVTMFINWQTRAKNI